MLKSPIRLALIMVFIFINTMPSKANYQVLAINEDEIIAIPKNNVNSQKLEKILLERNVSLKNKITHSDLNLSFNIIKTPKDGDLETLIKNLKKTDLFELIEPNYKLKTDYNVISKPISKIVPDDEDFQKQYYLDQTKVTNAWLYSIGSPNTSIAVLDSGIDYSNVDLIERTLPCISFIENSNSCQDDFGHGTQVTSIIAARADNKLALAGISWLNPILPIKVSNENGIATVSTVISGLEHAIKSGAKIVVISLSTEKNSEALELAIKAAYEKGILIISSGGNNGIEEIRYPAGYSEVIGVGSVNQAHERSSFSNTGSHISIVAPGENILVPSLDSNGLIEVSGTSFSAPQIAGIAALVWALRPIYNNDDVKQLILNSTKDLGEIGYDSKFGYGEVDAEVAVKRALMRYEKY